MNLITVKVGPAKKHYTLHTELLKYHSGFFRGALSGGFRETKDGIVFLKDIDTEAFDMFIDWLYQGFIPKGIQHHDAKAKSESIALRIRAYVLADRLMVPGMKVAVMDRIYDFHDHDEKISWYPRAQYVKYAWKNLTDDDPLLQLFVDLWGINQGIYSMGEESKELMPRLPRAFLARLLLRMNKLGRHKNATWRLKREDYTVLELADKIDLED